jgi:F420-dependent oxidoreductase-like protein
MGITISLWGGAGHASVADVVGAVRRAADAGFDGFWLPQTFTVDALTALALAGAEVDGIALGTAVVPVQGRHPVPLAQQALTAAQAVGPGRLTLGVGATHAVVSEGVYGIPYRGIVEACAESLEVLGGLLGPEHRAAVEGETLTARATLGLDAPAVPVLLAALGPRMLEVAGRLADGTVTWMTGRKTLADTVVPSIRAAAERAQRPTPRVVAGLPVIVTDDPTAARDRLRPRLEGAARMPSYRRQVADEGVADVTQLAILGTADEVAEQVLALAELGVTELMADLGPDPDEVAATTEVLVGLPRR